MEEERILCLFCLHEAAKSHLDKKGRPYLVCGWCGCRSFLRSFECFNGYRALAPHVSAMIMQLGGTQAFLRSVEMAAEEEKTAIAAAGGGR